MHSAFLRFTFVEWINPFPTAPSKENVGEALVPKRTVDRVGEAEYTGYSK